MAAPPQKRAKLVGFDNFKRHNPMSDRFEFKRFHHVELLCGDAKTQAGFFCTALGFQPIAHTNMMTGNKTYASYVVGSGSVVFACTAPYGDQVATGEDKKMPNPAFDAADARTKFAKHGLHVTAVGIVVADAAAAYEIAVANGAGPLVKPHKDEKTGVVQSEVLFHADGDAALRFVSGDALDELPFLPGFAEAAMNIGWRNTLPPTPPCLSTAVFCLSLIFVPRYNLTAFGDG